MFEQQVESLLHKAFEERPDLFLIEKSISPDHQVKIIIDGAIITRIGITGC